MVRRLMVVCAPLAVALALTVLATPSRGATYYSATLNAAQEGGVDNSLATGFGTVVLNDTMDQITVNETWDGLTAPATASHIHTGAAGTNGPVTFPFAGVPSATAGSIPEQSFAINAAQLASLNGGNMYFNIHTRTFPGGEIRGQIAPVPEPGAMAMLFSAAPAALLALRRRKVA